MHIHPCKYNVTIYFSSFTQDSLKSIVWKNIHGIRIKKATSSRNGEICVYMDRPAMFRSALGSNSPHQGLHRREELQGGARKTALINMADPLELSSQGGDITLCQMRTLLLSQHISNLMQANGCVLLSTHV